MRARILKRVVIGITAVLLLAMAGFLAWTRLARYSATTPAAALIDNAVHVNQAWYVFKPSQPASTGLVIYPGGLVDPVAYAPLARAIADRGFLVAIVPMPLDLAVLGINNADAVIAAYPDIQQWAVAGHSLGGSMAVQYIANHAGNLGKLRGLVLWASYAPDGADLSGLPIKAVSIYGSRDGVLRKGMSDADRLKGLPTGSKLVVIDGGDHAGFGDYGAQNGDNPATISNAEQQRQTAEATAALLASLGTSK